MKKIFKSALIVAAAALTLAACNKSEIENTLNEEDFYYTFALGSPETKSLLASDENGKFGAWEDGDKIGTAINDAKPGYAYVTTSTSPVTFSIYKSGGLSEGDVVYAYFPQDAAATKATEVGFSIPTAQKQDASSFDFDAMPMVAEGFVVPEEFASSSNNTEIGEINMKNLGSLIDFQVYSTNEDYAKETILSVSLSANKSIAGSFTKNLTSIKNNDESTLVISGNTETAITTSVANAPAIGAKRDAAANIYMVVAPADDVTGTVLVTTSDAKYTFNITAAQQFKRSGSKTFGLNLATCKNRVEEKTVIPVSKTISEILKEMGKSSHIRRSCHGKEQRLRQ